MSKKRKALEGGGGGGEPQLPEEEPTAWFGGSSEEPGRGRGRRQRTEHMRRALELRCSTGMPQSLEQLGRLIHRRETGGGVERSGLGQCSRPRSLRTWSTLGGEAGRQVKDAGGARKGRLRMLWPSPIPACLVVCEDPILCMYGLCWCLCRTLSGGRGAGAIL